jgi:hypothetical protein
MDEAVAIISDVLNHLPTDEESLLQVINNE